MITKEQYVQKHQNEIDDLSAELENLAAKIEEAKEKDGSEEDVKALRQHYDEAKAKLADIQAAGDNGWGDFKYGLEHTWLTMKESVVKIISRLRA